MLSFSHVREGAHADQHKYSKPANKCEKQQAKEKNIFDIKYSHLKCSTAMNLNVRS